jgi:hypothetical protein
MAVLACCDLLIRDDLKLVDKIWKEANKHSNWLSQSNQSDTNYSEKLRLVANSINYNHHGSWRHKASYGVQINIADFKQENDML